jgi:hypothetical protein
MKTNISIVLGTALVSMLAGCASAPVNMAAVGPNPAGLQIPTASGRLEVFSALTGRSEGDNPPWYQHTGYTVYDPRGGRLEQVDNTVGYYAREPRLVSLPAGKYIVEARAKGGLWARVPVVIEPGLTTKVHLDAAWQPPAGIAKTELVSAPAGYPVGWRAEAEND